MTALAFALALVSCGDDATGDPDSSTGEYDASGEDTCRWDEGAWGSCAPGS